MFRVHEPEFSTTEDVAKVLANGLIKKLKFLNLIF